jgi:protocatechuate 3,4-dioxygenase, alpha subunit
LKQLYTRVYFAGEPLNETDPVLSTIADPMRRQTLIATRCEDAEPATWRLDIVMQGDNETVFFDI